jgi:hypothetical protein
MDRGRPPLGIAPGDLTGDDYSEYHAVSAIVHAGSCDGIRYRSRFENDLFCIAVFERADDVIDLVGEGRLINRDWCHDMLKPGGYRLLDL